MTETGAFLMKDLVLLALSFYLLKQDLRASLSARQVEVPIVRGRPAA